MRTVVFDTETSGLRPGRICQLAYIIDEGDGAPQRGENTFFCVEHVDPGAEAVHGFSVGALRELSDGLDFSVHADRIFADFNTSPLWVAHNFDFDRGFLLEEFRRCEKRPVIERNFCTMRFFTPVLKLQPVRPRPGGAKFKFPTLAQLTSFFGLSDQEIAAFATDVFRIPEHDGLKSHDARFDSAAAYLCYARGCARGLIRHTL
ncbi:MAG: 3'-5' exonuclease [Clostridiales bacterium]|jgi:DNA polymerase-3 subunit epsilon|nr:3'-5' exonuclease [Clostridiales bacterium]